MQNINVREALDLLGSYLKQRGLHRTFIICGGASLILQNAVRSGRTTSDVDIVAPSIDEALRAGAIYVADQLGMSEHWLNSDPSALAKDMRPGWESRVFEVYSSASLLVQSISREDMIFAKFYAFCDRQKGDAKDLADLGVSEAEIDHAAILTEQMDGNPLWPQHVSEQKLKLRKALGYDS